MDPWLERIWVGSEAKEEGRGLNTGAYCSLTLAMVSRKTTCGEESTAGAPIHLGNFRFFLKIFPHSHDGAQNIFFRIFHNTGFHCYMQKGRTDV